ncbi:MAG: DNA mismatch repair endonuclease MutL [Lachnospiraceae bacterium]|nr:DNA mismatch repair endonuclease MutL [Lachnospiraceae bacterium]
MKNIAVLDQNTIDKIAAGEVIERPSSIVKELVENAIDAGATAITVEIKEGGISLIRITDNGEGIEGSQVPLAFLRHATSKISKVEDLLNVASLGFRGEALSSIAAVCQVELITKTAGSLMGTRYLIDGGTEKKREEIGAPEGTTFLVRNIFYNTPARKKFLKTPVTEAGYISDLMERMALSHPDISFKFINNHQTKLHTSGNANLKDIIYGIYGRDIASNLAEIHAGNDSISIDGFIGKPVISRGNRNYENYFINGRYIKSGIIAKAIEDGYRTFMMQHKYPFTALHFTIDGSLLDINVHPTKMELRFADNQEMYQLVYDAIKDGLSHRELIPEVSVGEKKPTVETPKMKQPGAAIPEPFEKNRLDIHEKQNTCDTLPVIKQVESFVSGRVPSKSYDTGYAAMKEEIAPYLTQKQPGKLARVSAEIIRENGEAEETRQLNLFEERLLSKEHIKEHRLIGQLFDTYWLVEFHDKLYIIDQHAAHEKVLYERTIRNLQNREFTSQQLSPPMILTLNMQEEELLTRYMDHFTQVGFEIEPFGGREYSVRAVPANLFGIAQKDLFIEMLDSLSEQTGHLQAELINEKIASMSCKAAVKGNHRMSALEAEALICELLSLDNPYNCPHGRPTIISMTKYELEKKFKRIL